MYADSSKRKRLYPTLEILGYSIRQCSVISNWVLWNIIELRAFLTDMYNEYIVDIWAYIYYILKAQKLNFNGNVLLEWNVTSK